MIVQEIRNDNVFGYVRYQGEPNRRDAVIEKLRKQGFRITKQRCIPVSYTHLTLPTIA